MLTKEKISDRIWVVYGENVEDVPRAFIRFQEFYENRDLKGKIVSVQDIEKWWEGARDPDNHDSYYQYWSGFNLPGTVFVELTTDKTHKNAQFNQLGCNPEENELLNLIADIPKEDLPYCYIIGLWKDSEEVLDHEVAHAMFGTMPGYKIAQIENVSRLPKHVYDSFQKELLTEGYHKSVILDEMQAYLSTYTNSLRDGSEEANGELIVYSSRFETPNLIKYTHPFVASFKKFKPS